MSRGDPREDVDDAAVIQDGVPGPAVPAAASAVSFEAFVAEHRSSLYGKAQRLCRGHMDADDLVQDALERAFKSFDTVRDPARARSWLLTILTNTFIDGVRKRNAQPRTDDIDAIEVHAVSEPPREPSPWELVTEDQLRAAIEGLPDDVRAAYRMFALEGKDYVAIAEALGVPKATVGTRLLRARRKLKEALLRQVASGKQVPR
jgi:RNA polymerase sigma-70 factor (ECF subfamily)